MKRILITGTGSYIGENVKSYICEREQDWCIDTVDMQDSAWRDKSFAVYDVVFHVAGIAHADVRKVSEELK